MGIATTPRSGGCRAVAGLGIGTQVHQNRLTRPLLNASSDERAWRIWALFSALNLKAEIPQIACSLVGAVCGLVKFADYRKTSYRQSSLRCTCCAVRGGMNSRRDETIIAIIHGGKSMDGCRNCRTAVLVRGGTCRPPARAGPDAPGNDAPRREATILSPTYGASNASPNPGMEYRRSLG